MRFLQKTNNTKIISEPDLKKQAFRAKNINIKWKEFKLDKKLLLKQYANYKFFIRTYGCQANVIDTEEIKKILIKLGFCESEAIEQADLVILNTCAIRENSEKKVLGEIGLLNKQRSKNNNFHLGVCGCIPQDELMYKKIFGNKNVDFIFGTHNIDSLPSILYSVYHDKLRIVDIKTKKLNHYKLCERKFSTNHKAFVKIMDGCNNFCTYCIVPFTRGQVISRNKNNILSEIKSLIKKGYSEITLIGQNVNDYGMENKKNHYLFHDLLNDVAKLKIKRIRFLTSNPWNFDLKVINAMKIHKNIMPSLHIPIQSGSNNILKKMNRKIKVEEYLKLIKYIRKQIPNISITTDIIVGFPNETKKEFQKTINLYKKIKFDNAYTFIFSKRNGTVASSITDHTPLKEKENRLKKLNKIVKKYAKQNNKKYLNKVVEVLIDGYSKTNKSKLTGYSEQSKVVNFDGTGKTGEIVKVKILTANSFSLEGKQIN